MDGEVPGPCLVSLSGANLGAKVKLDGHALEVGSAPNNALSLEGTGVAARHARLELRGRVWALINLAHRGATRVNGETIDEHRLSSGDRIELGEAQLVFSNPQEEYTAWLQAPANLEETDARLSSGYLRPQWRALRDFMTPNDALWRFSSSGASWQQLGGRAGVCVVREGVVVYTLVTIMN